MDGGVTFSDDDLARLKWNLENHAPNWTDKDKLGALLVRLETAEETIHSQEKALLECRQWLDEDNIGQAYWTPLYRDFRKRLDAAIQQDREEGK